MELYLHPSGMSPGHGQGQLYLFEFWNIYLTCATEMLPFESDISAANGRYGFNVGLQQFDDSAVRVSGCVHAYRAGCRIPRS